MITAAQRERAQVTLRDDKRADGSRLHLEAYLDPDGNLHVDGHDLGPVTASVSGDGEYEYFKTIAKRDVPRVLELIAAEPGVDVLEELERRWTGDASYDFEDLLRESDIPIAIFTWSG